MTVQFFDPVQESEEADHSLAPRLGTLDGKVLGIYNNNKLNAALIVEMIAEELARDFHFSIRRGEYLAYTEMEEGAWGEALNCDAVILANGDCGSCSSSGIANAIDLERRGVPAFLVSTPPFLDVVRTMVKIKGMPQIRWGVVEHPLVSLKEDALRERARDAARQFREIILSGQAERQSEPVAAAGAR